MGIFDMGKSISDTVGKITDKITSDKDRAEEANKIIESGKEIDIAQVNANNNFNIKNMRSWVEAICAGAMLITYIITPLVNNFFHTSWHGVEGQSELNTILLSMFGLGVYRLADKVIKK